MEKRIGIDKNVLGSDVLSGLIDPGPTNNLKEPVELIFENKKVGNRNGQVIVTTIPNVSNPRPAV